MARDYSKEYATDRLRDDLITFRLHKEDSKKFKEKLAEEKRTMSEFLKEQVEKYINE